MADKNDGVIEFIVEVIVMMLLVALCVLAAMGIIGIAGVAGSIVGSGVCLRNYGRAIINNISLEKPTV